MKDRIRYIISFIVLLVSEILIGMFATGFLRTFVGDVLVIPTMYFLFRMFFSKDSTFSVYVLPLLCYMAGWNAEYLQLIGIGDKLGVKPGSLVSILIGGTFDIKDIIAYFIGLMFIGLYLALEKKSSRKWWYPISVFLHWTWGSWQTMGGFFVYLWYIRCPHSYYGSSIRTTWEKPYGMSIGQFIFTPTGELSEEMAVHEYGHTFQSILLGPWYIIVVAIPSLLWGFIPAFIKMRREKGILYTSLYCEKWASDWGEAITKKKALRT